MGLLADYIKAYTGLSLLEWASGKQCKNKKDEKTEDEEESES